MAEITTGIPRRRGLTLMEVMISVALIAGMLLVMVGVFAGGLRLMERSEERTGASNLAGDLIETISDGGGFRALPAEDSVFDGRIPTDPVDTFPPAPYPGNDKFKLVVRTRALSDTSRAVLVEAHWETGMVKLEKVYSEVE